MLIIASGTHHIEAFDYDLVLFSNDFVDNALLALLYTTEHLNLVASHNVPSVRRYEVVLRKPRLVLHSRRLQLPDCSEQPSRRHIGTLLTQQTAVNSGALLCSTDACLLV
jgi:hypothetical protein